MDNIRLISLWNIHPIFFWICQWVEKSLGFRTNKKGWNEMQGLNGSTLKTKRVSCSRLFENIHSWKQARWPVKEKREAGLRNGRAHGAALHWQCSQQNSNRNARFIFFYFDPRVHLAVVKMIVGTTESAHSTSIQKKKWKKRKEKKRNRHNFTTRFNKQTSH